MNEREKLWAMLRRCKALCDRNADAICARIMSCQDLQALDYLFAQSKRQHALYMRIYARYDATLQESDSKCCTANVAIEVPIKIS